MIKTVKGDRAACRAFVEDLKNRVGQTSPEIENSVRDILENVRTRGDAAVFLYRAAALPAGAEA